ncbi:MAG: signal peptidase II [Acidimicrobiales bacterium]
MALVTIGIDRATKVWAERRLVAGPCRPGGNECIDLVGSLRFHLIYNPGAAFSKGLGIGPLFGVVAAVMAVVLLRLAATSTDRVRVVLFGLIAGGAVGNLIDRVVRAESGLLSGSVVDFIDLQWWPVFNVADAAVVCGVIAFVIRSMWADAATGDTTTGHTTTTGDATTNDTTTRAAADDGTAPAEGASGGDGGGGSDDTGVGDPAESAEGSRGRN